VTGEVARTAGGLIAAALDGQAADAAALLTGEGADPAAVALWLADAIALICSTCDDPAEFRADYARMLAGLAAGVL
jgi:hypothetical protein